MKNVFRAVLRTTQVTFCLAILLPAAPLFAQPGGLPGAKLSWVYPAGGKLGGQLDLTLGGDDLEGVNKLIFSTEGISAVQKTGPGGIGDAGPQPLPGQFTLTIAADAKPGIHEVRAVGKYGVSNPRAFVIGTQPELLEKEPDNSIKQAIDVPLGSVVNGKSDGGADQDYYKFGAKKGQRIIIDCWAYRIDSRMDATLILYNPAGEEIDRNRDTNRRDPLIDFTAPADGEYIVEVHDFLYEGANEFVYRLSIGQTPYIDFVFPPAGVPGASGAFTLYGRNLPGGQPAKVNSVDGKPLESLAVQIALPPEAEARKLRSGALVEPAEAGMDAFEYRLQSPLGASNPVLIGLASAPVVLEQEPNDDAAKPQAITAPCEVAGQFYPRGDQDWFSFQAKQGEVLWIEVYSQRLGVPTDPFLLVQQISKDDKGVEQVKDLQSSDDVATNLGGQVFDTASDDPVYRFVSPADGQFRVLVRNLYSSSSGDPRHVYRLSIRPAKPDFRLVAVPRHPPNNPDPGQQQPLLWNSILRKGGSDIIDVMVFREDGFDGEIEVSIDKLPPGVTCAPMTIGAAQNAAPLVLVATEDAADGLSLVEIVGKSKVAGVDLSRHARTGSMIWSGQQMKIAPRARMARSLAVGVCGSEAAPFSVSAAPGLVLEMSRSGKIQVPLKVARRGEFKGAVALVGFGLPQNVQGKNMSVDAAAAEGKFEITLPNNAPLGTFTFFLLGTSQVNYARNPDAIKNAQDRKAAIEKAIAERTAEAKAAVDAKAAAEKAAATAKDAATKAVEAQKAAVKTAMETEAAAKAAADKAKEAQAAAEKDAAKPELAAARQAADKAAEEALAKAKAAVDAKTAADKAVADAEAAAKTTNDAKTAADAAAAQAETKAKEAAAALQTATQMLTEAMNKSKPQNVNLGVPSNSITMRITAAPLTLTAAPPAAALKAGEKIELPVSIKRLYDFADVVQIKIAFPNTPGLSSQPVTIAAADSQAPLVIMAGKDTPAGEHKGSIQAVAKFNGQDVAAAQDIVVKVEKP